MGTKLLIRTYNVGCGDCIYIRIPEGPDGFHILIDCGRKGGAEPLEKPIRDLAANLLPDGSQPGRKRLDLLVATHRHEDHIKGFDPRWFRDLEVRHIWLSAVMDPTHPQARKVNELHALAGSTIRALAADPHALSPEISLLAALYPVSNDQADRLLMVDLPQANGIQPRYVHSGLTGADLGLALTTATIRVLGPEKDIDHFYLGEDADPGLHALRGIAASLQPASASSPADAPTVQPANIGAADFRLLRSRMLSNGLAFVAKDTEIQNNLSVVLLLEWKKRRLLFVGDAEWDGEFRDGKQNGSWNVMWEKHRTTHLAKPLDFLKVGHHGSINATPPPADRRPKSGPQSPPLPESSVYRILDTLLPKPKPGRKPTALAVVSTEREPYAPIPEARLLVDLAQRVASTRNYGKSLQAKGIAPASLWNTEKARAQRFYETYEKEFLDQPQPLRTDLEAVVSGLPYIDLELAPG